MKTNLISKAVVMLAVVMASVMNFSASASNPTQYVKNEEMTGELMTAKTIFKNEDGRLYRHLRYTYTYDTGPSFILKDSLCGYQLADHLFILHILGRITCTCREIHYTCHYYCQHYNCFRN